jgi:hypothetical protein
MRTKKRAATEVAALKCFSVRGSYEEQLAIGMNVK